MDAGVNILCYKSKTLANGAHPLMIRVCKDGKKKYVSLGVSVLPQFWDFTKNQPKKNCPNKAYIEKIIADKSSEFAERIIELKAEKKEFTATTLTERLTESTSETHGRRGVPISNRELETNGANGLCVVAPRSLQFLVEIQRTSEYLLFRN